MLIFLIQLFFKIFIMLILWKRYPFILWNSLILAFNRKCVFGKKVFFIVCSLFSMEINPFFLWKCSLFSMEISLYSMEKLSHSACCKGSRLRKRYLKLYLKYFKGETVLSDVDFCRLIRRNLFLLTAGAKKSLTCFSQLQDARLF